MRGVGGFTTVELLVTLFVASLFVMSGYQFYGAVSARSVESRMMSEASNLAQEVLAKAGDYASVTASCTATNQNVTNISLASIGASSTLPDLSVQVIRCQPIASSSIVRTTAVVSYDSPAKEVAHAKYVPAP